MQPHPHFTPLNQDDTHEKLTPHDNHHNLQKPTFRTQWSPFPWRTCLTILLLPLSLAPIISLSAAAEVASQSYIRGRDCYPNGLWKFASSATWEIMDSSYFFTPNLSFGAMTFTQVKVIDIAWDLVVGRGGQVMLAWVNYRVFNEWLVYFMESQRASWKMYAGLAFETTTVGTLGVLGKEVFAAGGRGMSWKRWWLRWLRWLTVVGMFLSTLYVLSFPTLIAAMTGYITKSEPYVEDLDKNLIAFEKVNVVAYVVSDAVRIGFEKPLVIGPQDSEMMAALGDYIKTVNLSNEDTFRVPDIDTRMFFYERKQFSQKNISSRWLFNNEYTNLTSPTLNITLYPIDPEGVGIPALPSMATYSISGRQSELYNHTYILSHSSCKPGETYQWGFSYIFLFMVSIFNFLWSCIMVGMWLDTRHGSHAYKSGRRPGLLRSIVEYAAAIHEEIGDGVADLEDDEIRKKLRGSVGRLAVPKEEVRMRRVTTGEEVVVRERGWKRRLTRGSTF